MSSAMSTAIGTRNKRAAFTLIELLVVIAIIAILAAILMPVLLEAKKRGQAASCISNLKQMSAAMRMFADDKGHYPGAHYPHDWYLDIAHYTVRSRGASMTEAQRVAACPARKYGYGVNEFFGYWLRGEYILSGSGGRTLVTAENERLPKRDSDLKHPSKIVYVGDFWHIYSPIVVFPEDEKRGFMSGRLWVVHNGGGHYLCADGHVKWHTATDVVPSMFDPTWRP